MRFLCVWAFVLLMLPFSAYAEDSQGFVSNIDNSARNRYNSNLKANPADNPLRRLMGNNAVTSVSPNLSNGRQQYPAQNNQAYGNGDVQGRAVSLSAAPPSKSSMAYNNQRRPQNPYFRQASVKFYVPPQNSSGGSSGNKFAQNRNTNTGFGQGGSPSGLPGVNANQNVIAAAAASAAAAGSSTTTSNVPSSPITTVASAYGGNDPLPPQTPIALLHAGPEPQPPQVASSGSSSSIGGSFTPPGSNLTVSDGTASPPAAAPPPPPPPQPPASPGSGKSAAGTESQLPSD